MTKEFAAWLALFAGLFLAAICWLIAYPSYAQETSCGPRRAVIDALREHYGEVEKGYGIQTGKKDTVILLLANEKTGTWTILRVQPDVACGIVSGTDFTLMFGEPA
ncbi:hypothetical protein GOL29_03060 [Sinorhizobium medicae]|nr:hypothetical protein [Sinorhizobium medicae]